MRHTKRVELAMLSIIGTDHNPRQSVKISKRKINNTAKTYDIRPSKIIQIIGESLRLDNGR